jgi:hypothetical protein
VTGRSVDAAVSATLAPYAWREFTDRMLARRVVGAVDRHVVVGFLAGLPGADAGTDEPVEPAEAGDERVDALLWALDGHQWRAWALDRLCARLVAVLEAWHAERGSLESDLRRLLEDS